MTGADVWFVVSWYGPMNPQPGTRGIVRGVHGRQTAIRHAAYWDARLDGESGGLAVFARAYPHDEAVSLFDLAV